MNKILEVIDLEKSYHENKAVNRLSFDVEQGEILGLLGPNGAGKSTTIGILSTIIKSDAGMIKMFDLPLESKVHLCKEKLGIVPQELALYEDISAYKNVAFFASLYHIKKSELAERVNEALRFVGLEDRKHDTPKTFSGGMKRRLNIACAIAHRPELLILDEPTVGIDPQSRNHILSSLKKLQKMGTTIIYTTHYMEEVEEISDRIVIMDKGERIAEGTVKELLKKYQDTIIYTIYLDTLLPTIVEQIRSVEGVQSITIKEEALQITVSKKQEVLNQIILLLVDEGYHIQNMETEEGNLEMVFLDLTGKKLRD